MSRRDTPARTPSTQAIVARILESRMPIYHRTYSPGELQFITTSGRRFSFPHASVVTSRAGADPRPLGSAMSRRETPSTQAIFARLLESRMPIYHRTYRPGETQFVTTSTNWRAPLGSGRGGLAQTPALWGLRCPEGTPLPRRPSSRVYSNPACRSIIALTARVKRNSSPQVPIGELLWGVGEAGWRRPPPFGVCDVPKGNPFHAGHRRAYTRTPHAHLPSHLQPG